MFHEHLTDYEQRHRDQEPCMNCKVPHQDLVRYVGPRAASYHRPYDDWQPGHHRIDGRAPRDTHPLARYEMQCVLGTSQEVALHHRQVD